MHKKIFIFGDSSIADTAGAKVVMPDGTLTYNPFGSKITLIDDLKIFFGWRVGWTAKNLSQEDFKMLKKIINQFKTKIDKESLVVLGFGAVDAECQFFGKSAKEAAFNYFHTTQNFFKNITSNILYIATTPTMSTNKEIINLLPPNWYDEKTKDKNHLDFAKELKSLCIENNIIEPFNKWDTIKEELALNYPREYFGPDGYHFNRRISDQIRLDLAKWIKKNRNMLFKTPLETWLVKNDDPYEESENIYDEL